MTYHPDQQDSSLPYNWYRKIAEMMNKPTVSYEEFSNDAAGNWLGLIGFKASPNTQNIQERGAAAREAGKRLDEMGR